MMLSHHGALDKLKLFHLEDGGFYHQRDYKLDQYSIPNIEGGKVKNITANAYIRDPKEYSSDMEVNYA